MKKGKVLTLLSLSVLTLGVVAGTIAHEGGYLTEFEAGIQNDAGCVLTFNKNTILETHNGKNYITDAQGYTKLAIVNGEKTGDNLVLKKDGVIYTDGTDYETNGWGSALNGLTRIDANFTGKIKVFTSYSSANISVDATHWHLLGEFTNSIQKEITSTIAPRYMKIVAVDGPVTFTRIKLSCVGLPTDEGFNSNFNGEYKGTMSIFVKGESGAEVASFTFKGIAASIKDSVITLPRYVVPANKEEKGTFVNTDLYHYGKDLTTYDLYTEDLDGNAADPLFCKLSDPDYRKEFRLTGDCGSYSFDFRGFRPVELTDITIKKGIDAITSHEMKVGESVNLTAVLNKGANEEIDWVVEGPSDIVSEIDPLDSSKIKITAGATDGNITVTAVSKKYNISSATLTIKVLPKSNAFVDGLKYNTEYSWTDDTAYIFATFSEDGAVEGQDALAGKPFSFSAKDLIAAPETTDNITYTWMYNDGTNTLGFEFDNRYPDDISVTYYEFA